MKKLLVTGSIGLGLLVTPSVLPAQDDMQRAIQWEHYKDAAAARQAALEKQHPSVNDPGPARYAAQSADREDTNGAARASSVFRTEPTAAELAQAVAWERRKDAAAARQASLETRTAGGIHVTPDRGSK